MFVFLKLYFVFYIIKIVLMYQPHWDRPTLTKSHTPHLTRAKALNATYWCQKWDLQICRFVDFWATDFGVPFEIELITQLALVLNL